MKKLITILAVVFARPPIAINHSSTEQRVAICNSESPIPAIDQADDWFMLSPYGEFGNSKGKQVVTKAAAQKMVAAFNGSLAKLGRMFRGVPVYVGHPDVMPQRWPDERRIGRVNALEAREDGIYAKVSWNDLGKQNLEQGYHVYPSPAWYYDDLGDGAIAPNHLRSIGLTNTPQIAESAPWTNDGGPAGAATSQSQAEANNAAKPAGKARKILTTLLGLPDVAGDQEINDAAEKTSDDLLASIKQISAKAKSGGAAAAPNAEQQTTKEVAVNDEEKKKLCEALGLDPAKTTNEQLLTAVNARNTATTTAADESKKFKKLAIENELNLAINDGRLTESERPQWATQFETDFDKAQTALKEKKAALNTQRLNLRPTDTTDLTDPRAVRLAFNSRLDELQRPDGEGRRLSLDQAINKMRATPTDAALIEAMNQADAKAAA